MPKIPKQLRKISDKWYPFTWESNPPTQLWAHDTGHMTRAEWLGFRSACDQDDAPSFGGSALGAIMGYDDYRAPLDFWYQKIGWKENTFTQNQYTLNGIMFESVLLNKWKHWNGYDWIPSMVQGVKHRDGADMHRTFWNPEYPWLFMNIDAAIFSDPEYSDQYGWGVGEIKTIGGHYADRLEIGFPYKYMFQVQGYMMGTGSQYSNLIMQVDLKDFRVREIFPKPNHQAELKDKCDRLAAAIVKARSVLKDKRRSKESKEAAIYEIEATIPDILFVDSSANLSQLLSQKQQEKDKLDIREAPQDVRDMAVQYNSLKDQVNDMKEEYEKLGNQLRQKLVHNNVRRYWWKDEFGETNYVSFLKKLMVKT